MHGHFTVNGRKTKHPSFAVRSGDVISVREESRKRDYFKDFGEILATHTAPRGSRWTTPS